MSATWTNWSGLETAVPQRVARPTDASTLVEVIGQAALDGLRVKAVGSGHSFTGVAVTDGVQVRLDAMQGIVDADRSTGLVRVLGGTRLADLSPLLARHGLAMPNLGDIDTQTITGAIATGTHGTGALLTGLAGQVQALTIVLADGQIAHCAADERPELFQAARVGLGALGIISEVTLQCVPGFLLHAVEAPATLPDVLEQLDALVDDNDHFEFYWFPHTDRTLTKRNNRVEPGAARQPLPRWRTTLDDELLSNTLFEWTNRLGTARPALIPRINAVASRVLSARSCTDDSWRVFASPRRVVFRECEYAVPRGAVPAVLAELRTWLDGHDERIAFPIEVRFAAPDDIWLSTAFDRANGYIAVHQYHRRAHQRYFAAFESIVAEHAGRPHWGKLHTLGAEQLRVLYPRFDDYLTVRDRVDPGRMFANAHLEQILGQ